MAPAGSAVAAPPIRLVAFCGSARPGSFTRKALEIAAAASRAMGAELTVVDLAEWRLPPFDNTPATEREHPEVQRLKALVRDADGLLIATPTYHDSYSGILKNALDLLYFSELSDKLAGLISIGGGKFGHGQALEHLRAVLRETGTWVLPRQVILPESEKAFDEAGQLIDPELKTPLEMLGQELVLRTRLLRIRRRPA
jgi:NAD(P)H-dependent FMN reductase